MFELTIGMAAYQDFDGVYFSVQDLRLHHDMEHVEILVVDNFGCNTTAAFVASTGLDGSVRYLRATEKTGTAAPRQKIFEEARGKAVLCMDAHVLLAPGSIARLKQFYRDHPATLDLYQGPLLHDDLQPRSTHFDPVWGSHMYGRWGQDARGDQDQPFEIAMQGLGISQLPQRGVARFQSEVPGFRRRGILHPREVSPGGSPVLVPAVAGLAAPLWPAPGRAVFLDRRGQNLELPGRLE